MFDDKDFKDFKPHWACKEYGNYEHDWMDCPDCVDGYEKQQEIINLVDSFIPPENCSFKDTCKNESLAHNLQFCQCINNHLQEAGFVVAAIDY